MSPEDKIFCQTQVQPCGPHGVYNILFVDQASTKEESAVCMPPCRDSPTSSLQMNTEGAMEACRVCIPFLLFTCTGANALKVRAKGKPVF